HVSRARWRLARLSVHDRPSQAVFERSPSAWFVLQPADPFPLVAVQPGADDIWSTGMNRRNLWDGEASLGQQDHLSAQGHPPDRLMAEGGQFISLRLRQGHVDHPAYLRLSEAAETVPHF